MHVIEQNESIMCDNQINHEITYVGPPPKPVYFAWINVTDFIILDLWKIHSSLLKSRGAEDRLKTRVKLKLFERKLDFWNSFEKLELWELNLKIEILRIKFKNWNFGNWNWKKLEFLKLFESWNYEN